MAITFALVDASPFRLRYLATQDGVISSPPVAADGLGTIPNDGGASPDLLTDVQSVAAAGAGGSALRAAIRARLDGFGPIAAATALTQAQARAILNSDDAAGAVLTNQMIGRTRVTLTPRTGNIYWSTDVNVDAGHDPVVEVRSATGTAATAYVDIKRSDSTDQ